MTLDPSSLDRFDQKINQINEVYHDLDHAIEQFQSRSGLSCKAKCGRCCENPYIDVTVLEMLPLVRALFDNKEVDQYWTKASAAEFIGLFQSKGSEDGQYNDLSSLEKRPYTNYLQSFNGAKVNKGRCVFYQPDDRIEGNGRCGVYPFRPLVCRLFGFSGKKDKTGKLKLVTCPIIKEMHKHSLDNIQKEPEQFFMPGMSDFSARISSIDPELGRNQLPMNEAFKVAVQHVGLRLKFRE